MPFNLKIVLQCVTKGIVNKIEQHISENKDFRVYHQVIIRDVVILSARSSTQEEPFAKSSPNLVGCCFGLLVDVLEMQFNHLLSSSKDISISMMKWSDFGETIQEQRIPDGRE